VSANPFSAVAAVREHLDRLDRERGDAIRGEVRDAFGHGRGDPAANMGGIVDAATVARICAGHGITLEQLMLLCLRVAEHFSHPPISHFTVGAIGLEAETGNLVLGGNLEFPGTPISNTVHGEGFVFARAFSRGTSIKTIAIGEAHPCAFCRQFLSEFAATANLTLIDPLGHRLTMEQLYPWPFDPAYLGQPGIVAGNIPHPTLELAGAGGPVAAPLTAAGRKSHVPYGGKPAAIALTLRDGTIVTGAAIESVSFNPTMHPLQTAMIDLIAHGYDASDIAAATLAAESNAPVDYVHAVQTLLAAIAPDVPLEVVAWAA
jgi:cytidine deaminase